MTRWTNATSSKEELLHDDISNHLSDTQRVFAARSGLSVPDRAGDRGVEYTELEEETAIQSWCWSRYAKPVSLELGFVAIMFGFGFVAVVGTLLGILEVGP